VSCRASCLGSVPCSVLRPEQSTALAESARDQPPSNLIKFNPLVNVKPPTHQSERPGDREITAQSAVSSDPGGGRLRASHLLAQALGTTGQGHRLGIRQSGVGTCARIAICNLLRSSHCAQKFVTASSSPERHVQKAQGRLCSCRTGARIRPKSRRWLLEALGPCLRPGIRHGADGSWNRKRDRCRASRP
jgi:hypothetical protein